MTTDDDNGDDDVAHSVSGKPSRLLCRIARALGVLAGTARRELSISRRVHRDVDDLAAGAQFGRGCPLFPLQHRIYVEVEA